LLNVTITVNVKLRLDLKEVRTLEVEGATKKKKSLSPDGSGFKRVEALQCLVLMLVPAVATQCC